MKKCKHLTITPSRRRGAWLSDPKARPCLKPAVVAGYCLPHAGAEQSRAAREHDAALGRMTRLGIAIRQYELRKAGGPCPQPKCVLLAGHAGLHGDAGWHANVKLFAGRRRKKP